MADHLRLVVDNKSDSESSTSLSRAHFKSVRCHLPGITSLARHMETADFLTPRKVATEPVPPKRSTMSAAEISHTSDMMPDRISQNVQFVNPENAHYVNSPYVNSRDNAARPGQNPVMHEAETYFYDGKAALERVKEAIRLRHKFDPDGHGNKQRAAGVLGVSVSGYSNWQKRGLPKKAVMEIAELLDVDVYYLLGTTPEPGRFGGGPDRPVEGDALGELRDEMREIKSRLANLEENRRAI